MFDLLNDAVAASNAILLKYFRTQLLNISHKTDHQNIVTVADKESQQAIQNIIVRLMKEKGETDVGFIGEEDLHEKGKHMFVIDPLDGTSNFAAGIDYFCTPIAYFREGELIAGILSRPTHNDIYYAEKGKGAFVLRNNIKVDLKIADTGLQNTFLSMYPEDLLQLSVEQRAGVESMFTKFRGVRAQGAGALDIVSVAENTYGCAIMPEGPWIWDIAASKIILEEAGGACYTIEGEPLQLDIENVKRYSAVACHPTHKEEIFKYVSG